MITLTLWPRVSGTKRSVVESPVHQGIDEGVPYQVTVTPWGAAPTTCTVSVEERVVGVWTNMTTAYTTGSAGVLGDVITSPVIMNGSEGHTTRLMYHFLLAGTTESCYCDIVWDK